MKTHNFLFLLLLCGINASLHAVQTVVIDMDQPIQFQEGEPISAAITSKGTIRKGVNFQSIVDFKDKSVWCGVFHRPSGEYLVGTGPECEVFAIAANGKERFLAKLDEGDVHAMAVSPKGEIYAATSPKGKIYKLNTKGDKEIYFEPNEEFIWDLHVDKDGILYAATGNTGKIFKITAKGQGEVYFDSDETSIRTLGIDAKGALLAGSGDNGLLYRITSKNSAVVLLEAGKGELRSITVSPQGTIYAAANSPGGSKQDANAKAAAVLKAMQNAKAGGNGAPDQMTAAMAASVVSTQGQPSSPARPEKSRQIVGKLYRLDGNFYPENIWMTPETIYSCLWNGDHLLLGTGSDGYLYRIDADNSWSQLGKVEASQITSLAINSNQKILATTSNSGRVWEVAPPSQAPSIYKSKVVDSSLFADWGRLLIEGQGKWSVRTRSGNTSNPDKSWNPWVALQSERIASPPARYVQFELSLESGEVERVRIFYLPQNQMPHVKKIVLLDPGIGFNPMPSPVPQPQPVTSEQLLSKTQISIKNPERFQPVIETALRTVVWSASDADQDQLEFKIEIREQGEGKWQILKEKQDANLLSWSTSGWPEGNYSIRITASDAKGNLQGKGLQGTLESAFFVIDHTPPQIFVESQKGDLVKFVVTDKTSLLEDVSVSEDGLEYLSILPVDGPLDDRKKTFEYKRAPGKPFYIRASDEAGNISGIKVEMPK